MQISERYGLVYVITKLGLLFVYDLRTATAVYRNRISPDPIFLTASSPSHRRLLRHQQARPKPSKTPPAHPPPGGFNAINRRAPRTCLPSWLHATGASSTCRDMSLGAITGQCRACMQRTVCWQYACIVGCCA